LANRSVGETPGRRSGIAALVLAVLGVGFQLVCFALSRIVELQGVPQAEDATRTGEAVWFYGLAFLGMIPAAVVLVGAWASAVVTLKESVGWRARSLGIISLVLLTAGVPFGWASFVTWAGGGW
jgi:hypothetical protein